MAPPPSDPGEADDPPLSVKEAWPTDRVQVGLQAVLLEEAGYTVTEAVIYYAEEKLRLKVAVDDALKAEALATLEAAKECANGPRPLPLVNDPRCVRCSLQPICLPDEVNHQRAPTPTDELTPRKIWPPTGSRSNGSGARAATRPTSISARTRSISARPPARRRCWPRPTARVSRPSTSTHSRNGPRWCCRPVRRSPRSPSWRARRLPPPRAPIPISSCCAP